MTAESREPEGLSVQWRMFAAIAAFIGLIALVYWYASYEHAGTTLLALAAGLALVCGAYLFIQDRGRPGQPAHAADEELYLPHASIWPFGLGVGALLMANGLALGLWAVLPGAALMAGSIWGFARQSKRRD